MIVRRVASQTAALLSPEGRVGFKLALFVRMTAPGARGICHRALIDLENREERLARDTDINNCRANRRERLFMKGKLLFFEGGRLLLCFALRAGSPALFSVHFAL